MTRSKTREAAENFSPNIVVSNKMIEKHASIESVMMLEEFNRMNTTVHNCSLDDNFNTSLLLLLLKKVSSARLGESDIHPISPKTPAPQCQPIDRKKRKGKRVEDYGRDRAA